MLTAADFIKTTDARGRKGVREWGTPHTYFMGDAHPRGMAFDCDARSAELARRAWLAAARKACRKFYGVAEA